MGCGHKPSGQFLSFSQPNPFNKGDFETNQGSDLLRRCISVFRD
jgi:hypothetical protein